MNEIRKCSISGVAFTLEVEAYNRLESYLDSLHKAYKDNADGTEIISDIEARIAELILSAIGDERNVVALPLIENIIAQLGGVDEISGEDTNDAESAKSEPRIPRRLYRDSVGAKAGGVFAGLGKYFNIDPAWLRLTFFVPALVGFFVPGNWMLSSMCWNLFFVLVVVYLIMWIVVPLAQSARQRLEMNGEKVSLKSIETATATADQRARKGVATAVSTLGNVVSILLKIFLGFLVFPLFFVFVGLIIGLFVVVFDGGGSFAQWGGMGYMIDFFFNRSAATPILGVLTMLVPIGVLIYVFIELILSRSPSAKAIIISLVVWILLICGLCASAVSSVRHMSADDFADLNTAIHNTIDDARDQSTLPVIDSVQLEMLLYDGSCKSIDR